MPDTAIAPRRLTVRSTFTVNFTAIATVAGIIFWSWLNYNSQTTLALACAVALLTFAWLLHTLTANLPVFEFEPEALVIRQGRSTRIIPWRFVASTEIFAYRHDYDPYLVRVNFERTHFMREEPELHPDKWPETIDFLTSAIQDEMPLFQPPRSADHMLAESVTCKLDTIAAYLARATGKPPVGRYGEATDH